MLVYSQQMVVIQKVEKALIKLNLYISYFHFYKFSKALQKVATFTRRMFCSLVRIFFLLLSILRLTESATLQNSEEDVQNLNKHNNLPLQQSVDLSATVGWTSVIINSTDNQLSKRSTDDSWITREWVGFGLGALSGLGLTLSGISNQCCDRNTLTNCGWNCILASVSTLVLICGSVLFTGGWPTGGTVRWLHAENKRDNENYISLETIVDRFNANGLYLYDPIGNNYSETRLGPYTDDAWFQIRVPGYGLIANLFLSSNGTYVTAPHIHDHTLTEDLEKRDYSDDYDSSFWFDAGLITSHCRYHQGQSDLTVPKDMNIIEPAVRDVQHVFFEQYGPYHWIINDNNHGNRHIAEGVMSYSDSFDGTRPGSPPVGGVPSECCGDHDEL